MFALGMLAGASKEVTEGQQRIRDRIERQLKEARSYSELARKRQMEADEVRTQIANANKTYGISEKTLFNAYRNGHLEPYLDLAEKARIKAGGNIAPAVLESYYEIPASIRDADIDVDEEINRAFGVLNRNIENAESPEDIGFGTLFMDALGVDSEGAARRGLRGQTVNGYSVDDLLNMPDVQPLQGTGGNISPELYAQARGEDSLFTPLQIAEATTEEFTNRVVTQFGGRYTSENARNNLASMAKSSIMRYMRDNDIDDMLTEEQLNEAISNIFKQVGGRTFVNTLEPNPDGNGFIWAEIDQNGLRSRSVTEEELMTLGTDAGSGEQAPMAMPTAETGGSPDFPPTLNHPVHGSIPFAYVDEEGKPWYLLPNGREVVTPNAPSPSVPTMPVMP